MHNNFMVLVDTYNTLTSGVPNFTFVAFALMDAGYSPRGIRLDSGDLAELSK
jgi:nicotinate phosphoribosyltransferase